MILTTLLILNLLQINSFLINDLEYSFKLDELHQRNLLEYSLKHENTLKINNKQLKNQNEQSMYLTCTNYLNNYKLKSILNDLMTENDYHPVYFSKQNNRVCYTYNSDVIHSKLNQNGIKTTIVPHTLKIGSDFHRVFDTLSHSSTSSSSSSSSFFSHEQYHGVYVMEFGLGLGLLGKGLRNTHDNVFKDFMKLSSKIQTDNEFRSTHVDSFFWTSEKNSQVLGTSLHPTKQTSLQQLYQKRKQQYLQSFTTVCDFSNAHFETSDSHITLTMKLSSKKSLHHDGTHHPLCVLQLASIASLHPDVTHVIFHPGAKFLEGVKDESYKSDPYETGLPATDQNQYVQTGSELVTAYSNIGIDGSGYILGMIDSGLDDLSCFLIDWSLTPTTRTAAADYKNPITEAYRRKVIQYIAWGDGAPAQDYDHGTWCGGSAIGRCNFTDPKANSYNGIAYNGKITVFDIDENDNFLNVPSLYTISLPPAYNAGARVHTNSWGTPGINTYTTKALDVDRFMYENTDFLFVVAAANDGDLGYKTVGSPGVSKNALTVGASSYPDHEVLVYFSSIGYGYDDHMIKPNIVTPGTSLLSTGVRLSDQTYSCNTQKSSGTSMATPIAAGAALLVRHYLENASFWGEYCDTTYRSCPSVVKTGSKFVSGALVKAILTTSGEGMRATSATPVLPAMNLTSPPDLFQGWGQVKLNNVLPIPGTYDFDLYVADYETLTSLTERVYSVNIKDSTQPLRATIVWIDPLNVMWASKNLLNDLDLIVTSPQGNVTYGNNVSSDEFNPVERVVIENPVTGVWAVTVVAKELAVGTSQSYAIVITSGGTVVEAQTNIDPTPIDISKISYDPDETACYAQQQDGSPANQYIRFQLEDWLAGESWTNVNFQVLNAQNSAVYECTFIPNSDLSTNPDNRGFQCAACLPESATYTAYVNTESSTSSGGKYMRVASPQCNGVSLSSLQQSATMVLKDGVCNECSSGSSLVQALMFANVTDDDSADYTWYGDAYYQIKDSTGLVIASGTLLISDEEADTYCLPNGYYTLVVNDDILVTNRLKHAKVVFSSGIYNETLIGTSEVTNFPVGVDKKETKSNDDDDTPVTESVGFIVGITIGCLVLVGILVFVWFKYGRNNSKNDNNINTSLMNNNKA